MKKIVVSVLGQDRPGIIAAITRVLHHADCNIENVSQTILQSEFSGIFIASIPADQSAQDLHLQLEKALTPLKQHVYIKYLEHIKEDYPFFESEPFIMVTKGPDSKGLVAGITEVIARYGANVTNLQAAFEGGDDPDKNIIKRITTLAKNLVRVCDQVGDKYGIPVVNKRIAVSPIAVVGAPFSTSQLIEIAKLLDKAAEEVDVDFIGGFTALVEKGMARGDRMLIRAIPQALAETERVCASVNVASTLAGINMDAVLRMGRTIKKAADLSAQKDGIACAKLCVFANIPQDIPFMAGAYLGIGEPDAVINVGVSGPGVVKKAIDRALKSEDNIDLGRISEIIKRTAYKITRVGEVIGREVAENLNICFGVVDLSLEKLEALTSVCSVGLDMVAIPGDTSEETISAIIADEMAIGVINKKTTAARLIPVPGKKAGERAFFGGLLGESIIIPVNNGQGANPFIRLGGHIPAPIHSLTN